ncbi:MAG: tyrosine-type recombinase/integrase [Dermatophilaceae bacterium]
MIASIAVWTAAWDWRVLPRARVAASSFRARVALPRVWSNPADWAACRVAEWVGMTRRSAPKAWARVGIDPGTLQRLFDLPAVRLRDKTLWRMLYENAARAVEILTLDIGDLDLDDKRPRIRAKGGVIDFVHWQSAARLLSRLIDGRTAGPLFLADRRPAPARTPAIVDTCPIAGRGQLSYQHAGYLFKQPSLRVIADGRPGWSLHGLRHAALTHLGSNGCTAVELQAKSRHAPLRTLMRPSPTWSAPRAAPSWPIHPRPLSGGPAVDGRRGPVRPTLPPCLPYPAGVWPVQISAARKSGSAVARLPGHRSCGGLRRPYS